MRKFIRHPAAIPIELHMHNENSPNVEPLNNVSLSGLSFSSNREVEIGTWLKVCIPLVNPPFEAVVRVVWCQPQGDRYDLGVELPNVEDTFKTRMVEQICHIEHYRKEVMQHEGRELSPEEAAMEWIEKYAAEFPQLDE